LRNSVDGGRADFQRLQSPRCVPRESPLTLLRIAQFAFERHRIRRSGNLYFALTSRTQTAGESSTHTGHFINRSSWTEVPRVGQFRPERSLETMVSGEPVPVPPRVQLSNCNPNLLTAVRPIEQISRDPWPPSAPARLHAGTQTAEFLAFWSAWRGPAWSPDGIRQSLSSAGRQPHPKVL
jgi:hypothetical protein